MKRVLRQIKDKWFDLVRGFFQKFPPNHSHVMTASTAGCLYRHVYSSIRKHRGT